MACNLQTNTNQVNRQLTEVEVSQRLQDVSAEQIKQIVSDNTTRKNHKENIQLLAKGIFYPHEYYKALNEHESNERLTWFTNRDSFFHGYASPKHFEIVSDPSSPSGKKVACFVLKSGVLPSEALNAIKEGLTLLGCGETCQIAQYIAIKDVWGTSKFDALFASNTKTPLIIGRADNNPISKLRNYLMQLNPALSEIKKGDLVYIQNANSYSSKHLKGQSSGDNTLCIDDTIESQKFTTLGLSPNGNSHEEIQDYLISKYNVPCKDLEGLSEKTKKAYLEFIGGEAVAKSEKLKNTQITLEEFKEQNGGTVTIVCELDAKRITAIANSSLKQARKLFDSYDVRKGSRIIPQKT